MANEDKKDFNAMLHDNKDMPKIQTITDHMYLHDLIIADFERTKSFSELIYLLGNGRELEFSLYGKKYFISCDKSSKYVSIWDNHNEQSFDSIEEKFKRFTDKLIKRGCLNGYTTYCGR